MDEIYQEFLADVDKVKEMKSDISNLRMKLNEKQNELMNRNEGRISGRTERKAYRIKSINGAL